MLIYRDAHAKQYGEAFGKLTDISEERAISTEAASSSEMSVDYYQIKRRHVPEGSNLRSHALRTSNVMF
jgi:hypothetical protein